MTESNEREKTIRTVNEMTKRLGYTLAPGENKYSAYRVFDKHLPEVENGKSLIFVTETGMGSKHIEVGVSFGKEYRQFDLEKVAEGVSLPSKHPEGYRNMDLESGGYNKIVAAIQRLEASRFFISQASELQEIRMMVREQRIKDRDYVLSSLIPSIRTALPKFAEFEDKFLETGTVYLFPKTKSTNKSVSVISLHVDEETVEIWRSKAKIVQTENGATVDRESFRKRRDVGPKYQYPYYVWEGKREELDQGIERLVWFMGETKF